jgi:two-component system, NtrC family, response regulator AtoC
MTRRVLLVEDEANYRAVLSMMLSGLDLELLEAEDGVAALAILERADVDLVVTDVNMPRMGGIDLLKKLVADGHPAPVVVVTAYSSVDSAVEAMREGAIDYLSKPFDEARLLLTMRRALRHAEVLAENRRLKDAVRARYDFSAVVGRSEALLASLARAGKAAQSDVGVLLRGESGTGKELVARAIHFNSKRASGPFVALNCAAVPEGLLEAELFGAEQGAYTGATKRRRGKVELARGGTLFLDEIGDMPLVLQAKLLRLLQERTFTPLGAEQEQKADVRFVFATHRDLEREVAAGRFREDLLYRVAVLPVVLPPLRDRGDDVMLLADAFAAKVAEGMGRRRPRFAPSAERALRAHGFPGNVRELWNVVERAVILTDDDVLEAPDLGLTPTAAARPAAAGKWVLPDEGLSLEDVEKDLVRQALEKAGGNKSQAARLLGLTRATLRYRIEKMGLEGVE